MQGSAVATGEGALSDCFALKFAVAQACLLSWLKSITKLRVIHFAEVAMDQLVLQPISKIEGHVKLPGSKSLSNRILLLAALSTGITVVKNLLVSPNPVMLNHVSPYLPCLLAAVNCRGSISKTDAIHFTGQ